MARPAIRNPARSTFRCWSASACASSRADDERHGGRFEFVYAPLHASWNNQIELWFSILERRVLRRGSFEHLGVLQPEVEAFIRYWNRYETKPFRWTFDGRFEHTRRRAA